MLRSHLDYLLEHDVWFKKLWRESAPSARAAFIQSALRINRASEAPEVETRFRLSHAKARRVLLVVPERNLVRSQITRDWNTFATDLDAKNEILRLGFETLYRFIEMSGLKHFTRIYGGLKDTSAIQTKPDEPREPGDLVDLWDVVRFRIVVPDLKMLIKVSLALWNSFLERVVKCRNYYSRSKMLAAPHPYNAIHFQLPVEDRMAEVQIMSRHQETIAFLDHAISFKKSIIPMSEEHSTWLERIRLGALLVDVGELAKQGISSPADLIC